MRRRAFVGAVLTAAGGLPRFAVAQPAGRRFRIAWVSGSPQAFSQPFLAVFRDALHDLGYVEGRNLVIEVHDANDQPERLSAIAHELAESGVDAIMTLAGATRVIVANAGPAPVVYVFSADPIEAGLTQSLARPSGNATGITLMSVELNGKRLELLRQIRPDLKRAAIIASPDHAGEHLERENSAQMARLLGIEIAYFAVHSKAELEASLVPLVASEPEAIVAFPDPVTVGNRARIVEVGMAKGIPVVSGWALFARTGALCTYGPKLEASYQRAASFVDRILKGAKPGELPIERPSVFELVINMKTANALRIGVPQAVLARADEVIE